MVSICPAYVHKSCYGEKGRHFRPGPVKSYLHGVDQLNHAGQPKKVKEYKANIHLSADLLLSQVPRVPREERTTSPQFNETSKYVAHRAMIGAYYVHI